MAPLPAPLEPPDIFQLLAARARSRPFHAAIRCGGHSLSHAVFEHEVGRVAGALQAHGVERGDRIALTGAPSPAYVIAFLGAVRAGGCAVPLPETASRDALDRMLRDSSPRALFASCPSVRDLPANTSALRVALDGPQDGWTGFDAFLDEGRGEAPAAFHAPDDAFNLLYSSGTTGHPKGIVQSHAMRAHHAQRMRRLGLGPRAVTLISTPLCSNATWISLLPTLAGGGTVVLLPAFDEERFLAAAASERATHALLVPAQIRRLLDTSRFHGDDFESYEATLCTGAPLPAAWKRDVLERWPGRLLEIYGQTEGGCVTVLDAQAHPSKLDTVGRPAQGVEVRIVDEADRVRPQGAVGEICGRGAGMMSGYHGRPDWTEALTWRDDGGCVFYRSGDLGRMDEEGFLHLVGRKKDVIISGGQNVHARDLEDVLIAHADVVEAAVVGLPSERWGETPFAVVVPAADATVSDEDLLRWANERLGRHQRLAGVVIRDALPRTALGKVRKADLAAGLARVRKADA